ncbi:histidinol dehydrogenase [Geothrix oryzae]|uniref:Histidinol dehydrogenase n=1 Tax=Geothrix oryzae TaxID=2927975 RepID=A0ABM8DQA6_9BACT|nr:histidinol dehydrogenase [Geothrix oryzae]BDU69163.1 histidinol dehydrogenase [Geothrix oryzae]
MDPSPNEVHRCYFISISDLTNRADVPGWVAALARSGEMEEDTREAVAAILRDVRQNGLPAAVAWTARLDGVRLDPAALGVPASALEAARTDLDRNQPDLMAALREMIANVRRFAEGQRDCLRDLERPLPGGGTVGERWCPLKTAGVYIPGGRAFYPSTLAMTVIPAQVAGVARIVGVTPPKPEPTLPGAWGIDPLVLACAAELGLTELYPFGGAQALGWLAYGEPAVDLVAGPGNRFVAEAKRQLIGTCGIDALAGPTELLVIADGSADPAWVAEDLLAQAEHDPDAAAVLVSADRTLLQAVAAELQARVAASPRKAVLEQSLGAHGRLVCAERELAIALAQAWAPEHLELCVSDPEAWLPALTAAGALFIGSASAEAFGDYGAGPNHVLPTNRSARYTSPLGVATFLKRQSLLRLTPADAAAMAPWVERLAEAEGLVHHGRSAALRAAGAGLRAHHRP